MDSAVQSYIGYVNYKLEKVVHNLHIIFFPVLKPNIIVEKREKVVCSNLKEAITVHIKKENLSFKYVESPSLAELLGLCNASVPEMMVKADSIAEHVISKYLAAKEKIKIFFQSVSSKISLTCDLWTSPNRLAILCVTSHWTDKDLEVREIILDAVKMEGPHTGEYIASHIYFSCS
jgi:hypothetical protein